MRRRLRVLAVLSCAFVVLGACTGGGDDETASSEGTPPSAETPTPTPIPTETVADEDEDISDAEKALIEDTFIPPGLEKRFTYLWATGNLLAFMVIGGSDKLQEDDARAGAVLVEQRMETITGVDGDGDGNVGS